MDVKDSDSQGAIHTSEENTSLNSTSTANPSANELEDTAKPGTHIFESFMPTPDHLFPCSQWLEWWEGCNCTKIYYSDHKCVKELQGEGYPDCKHNPESIQFGGPELNDYMHQFQNGWEEAWCEKEQCQELKRVAKQKRSEKKAAEHAELMNLAPLPLSEFLHGPIYTLKYEENKY
jgi:hypothetical protein